MCAILLSHPYPYLKYLQYRQGAGELPDGDEQVVHLCASILDDQTEHDCH